MEVIENVRTSSYNFEIAEGNAWTPDKEKQDLTAFKDYVVSKANSAEPPATRRLVTWVYLQRINALGP